MPLILTDSAINWRAEFVWTASRGGHGLEVRLFRINFDVPEIPESLVVHVSADSRYRLLLNGRLLGRGPAKSTLEHYIVDTYELAPELVAGRNVLAAEVRWFGENSPLSEVHSREPGFLVHSPLFAGLNTPGRWRVCTDPSVTPDTTSYHDNAQSFLNHMDRVDFRVRQHEDWTLPEFDDSSWELAVRRGQPVNSGAFWAVSDLRTLHPRDIPLLTDDPRQFSGSCTADNAPEGVHETPPRPWRIPAGVGAKLILDAGTLTTGYPVLTFAGGRDREVRVTYAEAMGTWVQQGERRVWMKSRRDDPDGEPHGYRDTLTLSGLGDRFEPFHWRTFWFIAIEVLPGPEACEMTGAHYRRSVFPQKLLADFESSDDSAQRFLRTSWRTSQLCAHETYEDCPYYEQQNYIADSRLQALTSYYLANETRLARRCLRLYRDSARADGLLGSRVPSHRPQVIPYFCLHWIFMVEDYWLWVGERDKTFIRTCLPIVDGILVFFRERLREDGFVGNVPGWNMVDRHPEWPRGEPPAVVAGDSTYLTCLFIQGIETAIRLHSQAGRDEDAERWRKWPDRLREAVRKLAWNPQRGLYIEGANRPADRCSLHTQCAAVLAGVPREAELASLLPRLVDDPELIQCNFMQSFYVARVLEATDTYARFHEKLLDPWRQMDAMKTTTWWEYPDPTRSDCHAWSSWIATDYFSTVLGIKPAKPGWTAIRLAPRTDGLDWARGSIATPAGKISVEWTCNDGMLEFKADTPPGVPVELKLPGETAKQFPNGGTIVSRQGRRATTRSAAR